MTPPLSDQIDSLPIDKADRHILLDGLSKLNYGRAREIAARIEATKCKTCGGDGFAAYIGGDDTDDGCPDCDGTGFAETVPFEGSKR